MLRLEKNFTYEQKVFIWHWKSSFLSLRIFHWLTFSRQVTARWWRQSAKDQVSIQEIRGVSLSDILYEKYSENTGLYLKSK